MSAFETFSYSFTNSYQLDYFSSQEEILLEMCGCFGVSEDDVMLLLDYGYTADDVEKIITGNISTIRESESIQWDKVNIDSLGQTNFTCKFCQFLGTVPDDSNGFRGCKCSYDQGYRQVRGLKFNLREQK